MKSNRILLVDDDPYILASLTRQLRKEKFEVDNAQDGKAGLAVLKENGPFAVVVSDYRMPGMDGVEFLSLVEQIAPDTARIMLTGTTELEVAIDAVNRGHIFRFLLKPLSPDDFIRSVCAGIEQYRLVIGERNLLEELSVMQQIDRELNTNLNTGEAMRITLDWAMRRSGAQAGFVGMVKQEHLAIMAVNGYSDELQKYQDTWMPLEDFPYLMQTIEAGVPCPTKEIEDGEKWLRSAFSQVVIPIRRENKTIGILLLESSTTDLTVDEVVTFLVRLCDHASIAISNAELYAEAEAANQAKSEFVSFASHELRNPLTAIGGFVDLMYNGNFGQITDTQRNVLSTVQFSVQRMVTLISDLSDISRIESGHLHLEIATQRLEDLVNEVKKSQQIQIEDKKQVLEVRLPEDLKPVYADRMRTVQVLANLVSNAHKYTPEGGEILLSAEVCSNQWDRKGSSTVVHVWVQDNGLGISPEDQKSIFQKFFRAEDSKAREAPGTGLGLSITKNLVEMQGGRIWFESELRKGTTFHFTLPVSEQG